MRVAIIGNSGSGKTTLAERLAGDSQAVMLGLDTVAWEPHKAIFECYDGPKEWLSVLSAAASLDGRPRQIQHQITRDSPQLVPSRKILSGPSQFLRVPLPWRHRQRIIPASVWLRSTGLQQWSSTDYGRKKTGPRKNSQKTAG